MFIISLIFKASIIEISNLYTGLNLNDNYFGLLSIAELSLCFICFIRSKNKKNIAIHNKETSFESIDLETIRNNEKLLDYYTHSLPKIRL